MSKQKLASIFLVALLSVFLFWGCSVSTNSSQAGQLSPSIASNPQPTNPNYQSPAATGITATPTSKSSPGRTTRFCRPVGDS